MIFDLSRMRGPLTVLLSVALVLGAYGAIINAAFGRQNAWILSQDNEPGGPPSIEDGARRVLGILHERAVAPGPPDQKLGILIGASTLFAGIDPKQLTAELGGKYRWANLRATGLPYEYALLVKLMYQSGLRPDVLALVSNAPLFVTTKANLAQQRLGINGAELSDHARYLRVGYLKTELIRATLIPWDLAFPYRGEVSTLVNRTLFATKLKILERLGLGLDALYAPDRDPWTENPDMGYEPLVTDENKQYFLKGVDSKGWFDGSRYRALGPPFASLVEALQLAHSNGTKTFIVLVPESGPLRARLPADEDFHLTHTLRDVLGSAAPVILDYRTIAPDEEFHDPAHLNRKGIDRFTRTLAAGLRPYVERDTTSGPKAER
jgi:hypothetical protein